MSLVSLALQIPSCPDVNLKPRQNLNHVHKNFLFVKKPSASLQLSLGIPRRDIRDVPVKISGTKICPWTWGHDDNPDRVLTKAACPSCGHYCSRVLYYHRGLVQRCDARTGETVWKRRPPFLERWHEVIIPDYSEYSALQGGMFGIHSTYSWIGIGSQSNGCLGLFRLFLFRNRVNRTHPW